VDIPDLGARGKLGSNMGVRRWYHATYGRRRFARRRVRRVRGRMKLQQPVWDPSRRVGLGEVRGTTASSGTRRGGWFAPHRGCRLGVLLPHRGGVRVAERRLAVGRWEAAPGTSRIPTG
jgi:hypothetical protein